MKFSSCESSYIKQGELRKNLIWGCDCIIPGTKTWPEIPQKQLPRGKRSKRTQRECVCIMKLRANGTVESMKFQAKLPRRGRTPPIGQGGPQRCRGLERNMLQGAGWVPGKCMGETPKDIFQFTHVRVRYELYQSLIPILSSRQDPCLFTASHCNRDFAPPSHQFLVNGLLWVFLRYCYQIQVKSHQRFF